MATRILQIKFESSFHHGSGFGLAGIVDRTVLRDCHGLPYLAGSAIKGKFRHAVLRLLLDDGKPGCEYGDQATVCIGDPCLICSLFGSPFRQGKLRFSDAHPVEPARTILQEVLQARAGQIFQPDSRVRANIAMDRARGTAQPALLFSTEVLPEVIEFQAEIFGEAGADGDRWLTNAAKLLTHFGAGSSRGLGRATYSWGTPS